MHFLSAKELIAPITSLSILLKRFMISKLPQEKEIQIRMPTESKKSRAPITGGNHSYVTVKPTETVKVNVEANTALIIENKSNDTASVDLYIKGDTGLSMGYKK